MVDGQVEITPMCLATVRGFISLLVAAIFGAGPAEVIAVKPTLLTELGLVEALGMAWIRGLHAILHRIKSA